MQEPAVCSHCHHSFDPPPDLVGGMTNCPRCGRAVDVPGLRDPAWTALRAGAVLAAVAAGVAVGQENGVLGLATAVGLLGGLWLLSRAL